MQFSQDWTNNWIYSTVWYLLWGLPRHHFWLLFFVILWPRSFGLSGWARNHMFLFFLKGTAVSLQGGREHWFPRSSRRRNRPHCDDSRTSSQHWTAFWNPRFCWFLLINLKLILNEIIELYNTKWTTKMIHSQILCFNEILHILLIFKIC